MKNYVLLAGMLLLGTGIVSAQVDDDIYYNPKKATSNTTNTKSTKSNYISNFQDMDVDEYNLRGQYYTTPIDTIGAEVEAAPDFVYTTQIQKYYNPTIVVDNEDLLADVIDNSYGNVNIEFNYNGAPYLSNWYPYSWNIYSPYFSFYSNWGWFNTVWGPSWSIGWGSPWWSNPWSWSWGWGPSYAWGWNYPYYGPSWGWGGYVPPRPVDYRPGGGRPVNPGYGWASNHRPTNNYRPGNTGSFGYSRPGSNNTGTWNSTNSGRQPGQGAYTSNPRPGTSRPANSTGNYGTRPGSSSTRPSGTVRPGSTGTTRPGTTGTTRPGISNTRPSTGTTRPGVSNTRPGSSTSRPTTSTTRSSNTSNHNYNSNSSNSYNSGTHNYGGSYSTGRSSSSGGFGGSRPSGGGYSGGGARPGGHR